MFLKYNYQRNLEHDEDRVRHGPFGARSVSREGPASGTGLERWLKQIQGLMGFPSLNSVTCFSQPGPFLVQRHVAETMQ